jgi:glutamyl-tRNA synthetase
MARLGSSQPVELAGSIDDLAAGFDISNFGAAPTKFDEADLFPLTARYLHGLPYAALRDEIAALGVPADLAEPFWNVVRENITTRAEIGAWWALCRDGATPEVAEEDRDFVAEALALLPEPPYDSGTWPDWTEAVKQRSGRKGKALFMPLRKAVTGRARGPEMADLMPLLQKKPG